MSLFDDLKNTALGGIKENIARQAEGAVKKVTDRIPGELDDKIAGHVVSDVEQNFDIQPADKTAAKTKS